MQEDSLLYRKNVDNLSPIELEKKIKFLMLYFMKGAMDLQIFILDFLEFWMY